MIISIPFMDVDGTPTAANTAVLRDPTSSYGIRTVDDGAIVVPANTALTIVDGDHYEYDFDDAVDGTDYEAWFELTYEADVYRTQHFFNAGNVPTSISRAFKAAFVDEYGEMLSPVTAPTMANPSDTFGAKRLSDSEVVVASGSAMTEVGDGLYRKTVSLPLTDETERFRFYVHALIDETHFYLPSVSNGQMWSVALALGRYTNSYRVGQLVGHDNVYLWAGTPQYGTEEADEPVDFALRLSQFIRDAENWLDEELLGAYVDAPFTDPVPAAITRMATVLAATAMYESRGVDDVGEGQEGPTHRLSGMKREVLKDIRRVKMGLLKIGTLGYGPSFGITETGADD